MLSTRAGEWVSGIAWPEPKVVDPGPVGGPPSDAVVLFDGKSMSAWEGGEEWPVKDGYVVTAGHDIHTKQAFGDCQLHVEWATPEKVKGHGQERGNSGVFLMGLYEIQILDSYNNPTYFDGQAAAVYKQRPPLVNACRKPGQWQTYDILFEAPRFDAAGKLVRPAYVTVLQNGVLVQNHFQIQGHHGLGRSRRSTRPIRPSCRWRCSTTEPGPLPQYLDSGVCRRRRARCRARDDEPLSRWCCWCNCRFRRRGRGPVEGNVPLGGGLPEAFRPAARAGRVLRHRIAAARGWPTALGDQGLVEAILSRQPWMVGFTCYMWNVERSLWIAGRLKQRRPELKVLLGGPEITADNPWVLAESGRRLRRAGRGRGDLGRTAGRKHWFTSSRRLSRAAIAGLSPADGRTVCRRLRAPPLENLDAISSPYVEGILDLADCGGCCWRPPAAAASAASIAIIPRADDPPRFLSAEQILANLNYAAEHGATEVVLLDPTLNQRPDFAEFLRLLAPRQRRAAAARFRANCGRKGSTPQTARLLRAGQIPRGRDRAAIGRAAGVGVDGPADEPRRLRARRQGAAGRRDRGPGRSDPRPARRYGRFGPPRHRLPARTQAYSEVQVFNLSILPGTAFRREAEQLGLKYQPWPPYYVLRNANARHGADVCRLMEEAQEAFGVEFDALPPPRVRSWDEQGSRPDVRRVDLDALMAGSECLPHRSC